MCLMGATLPVAASYFAPQTAVVAMMGFSRFVLTFCAAALAALLLLAGCDGFGGGDEYRPYVTEILDVRVEPNPVAAGDTAIFTCVIEDSTDTTLVFKWFLENTFGVDTTGINRFEWVAPSETGTYSHKVQVDRPGDASVHFTQERFSVTVVENE